MIPTLAASPVGRFVPIVTLLWLSMAELGAAQPSAAAPRMSVVQAELFNLPGSLSNAWADGPGFIRRTRVSDRSVPSASGAVGTFSLYQSTKGATAWERVGQGLPANSRINALVSVEQGVIAGTDAGVYVSNDAGRSWRPASKGPGTAARILCLATMAGRVFAGTHQHGVLVSDDAGTTWRAVTSGLTDRYVRSLLAVGHRLFAGTDRSGVFVSEDVGKTWQRLSTGLPTSAQVFDLAAFDGSVFAGLYANGLYRLAAKESVWRKSGDVQPLELAATGRSLIVGHNPGGVFVSTDRGRTWTDGNRGLPVNVPIWTLAADEKQVLAGATGKIGPAGDVVGLFRSTDHGHTWTRADQGLPGAAAAISFLITEAFVLAGIVSP